MKKISAIFIFLLFQQGMLLGQVEEGFDDAAFPPVGWTLYSTGTTSTWNRITSNTRNASTGAASSLSPAAGSSKHLTVSMNVSSSAISVSYYVSLSSMTHGTGATLVVKAGTDTTSLITLRTINLDSSSVFSVANTYVQFTDNIDGTAASGQTGTADLRSFNPAFIRWSHQKTSGTAASCRLEDISIPNALALPVELTSFTAVAKGKSVELAWQTATEVNNHGFEVERKQIPLVPSGRSPFTKGEPSEASGGFEKVGFVAGNGTTNLPKSYSFIDATARGSVAYRLKQIDNDGKFEYSKEVEVMMSQIPQMFALMQNHPNPFNPTTEIRYQMSEGGLVSLNVYDVLGREVATLVNEVKEAGEYTIEFDASQYPSGIYFYTMQANNFTATKKMLMLK